MLRVRLRLIVLVSLSDLCAQGRFPPIFITLWRLYIMSYTLKRSINGFTLEDIKRIYDNNPNMTLKELSNLTGLAVPFLKKLLMS